MQQEYVDPCVSINVSFMVNEIEHEFGCGNECEFEWKSECKFEGGFGWNLQQFVHRHSSTYVRSRVFV